MRSGFRYILYIIIALIVVGGLTLFVLRDQAVTFLSDNTGVTAAVKTPSIAAGASKDALDNSLLSASKFVALKNNVVTFDFDSICKTPVGKIEVGATSSDGVFATSTQTVSCDLGNNVPFPVPPKKE